LYAHFLQSIYDDNNNSIGYAGDGLGLQPDVDYTVIAKGFRNPYRAYLTPDDIAYVTDVGSGGEDNTERLYTWNIETYAATNTIYNGGWPCVLSLPLQGQEAELIRQDWLTENNRLDICQVSCMCILICIC
jgi:hypothetical protein